MVEVQHLVLFRGPFYVVVYLLLMAVNVYGWRRAGVNHILIFEINPRKHLTYSHLLELSAIFGVLTALSVLGFIYAKNLHIPRFWFPLILLITMVLYLILPLPIFHLDSRLWLLKVMVSSVIVCILLVIYFHFCVFPWYMQEHRMEIL